MVDVPGEKIPRVYSEANACPTCGIGFPELSPQSFSFNSPLGMCVECNGLGERLAADPDLVVPDPTLSIREGAVAVWGEAIAKDTGWTSEHRQVARQGVQDRSRQAVEEARRKQHDILLHGVGDERMNVTWDGRHWTGEWAMRFEGILAQIDRRYREIVERSHEQHYEHYFRAIPCACVQRHASSSRVARGVRQRETDRRGSPA